MSGHGGRACTNRNARSLAMLTKSECLRRGAAHKARAFRSGAGSPQGGGSVWGNIVITACLIALSARNSSDRLFLQLVSGSKASIFVRKTLQVFPCEIKKALAFLSSQKRSAFFDEDDVCGRSQELRCSLSELSFGLSAYKRGCRKAAALLHYFLLK